MHNLLGLTHILVYQNAKPEKGLDILCMALMGLADSRGKLFFSKLLCRGWSPEGFLDSSRKLGPSAELGVMVNKPRLGKVREIQDHVS